MNTKRVLKTAWKITKKVGLISSLIGTGIISLVEASENIKDGIDTIKKKRDNLEVINNNADNIREFRYSSTMDEYDDED